MYTKTQWVDNTTPIDKDNLNKIEQGIYDNSLVVDAVTNTLNPTDTETYKTAELTEGQITDVIGVSDIVIKGQTLQDGTPTPSAPVDVNVVSGSNVINTSNKNLFDVNKILQGDWNNPNSSTSLVLYLGKISEGDKFTASNYNSRRFAFIISNMPIQSNQASALQSSGNQTATRSTFTATANGYVFFKITKTDGGNITPNEINSDDFQIEKGSTATTYETHQGKELPLDLPVENLLNVNEFTSVASARIVSNATSGQTVNGIVAKPGTYTASFNVKQLARSDHRMQLIASSDSTQTQSESDITNRLNTVTVDAYQLKRYSISITVEQECYLYLRCVDTDCILNKIQLEQGSKANAYTPYGTEPIELCKIGNYQDYFYKSGSKWYLHKEINKKTLDGTENWEYQNSHRFIIRGGVFNEQNKPILASSNSAKTGILSTHSNEITPNETYSQTTGSEGISYLSISEEGIAISCNSIATTTADFKTWLANNLPSVYYILKTSRNIEITDTTLISQLEAIYNAPLYEQTNITQENNDLPMVLDITACKDNINGIKAWIRR